MNDKQLAEISDKAYFDSWRDWVSFIDGGDLFERNGVLAVCSGMPVPWLNIAFVTRKLDAPRESIRGAVSFFEDRGQPFIIRVRDGVDQDAERAAEQLGFPYSDTVPGLTLHPIPDPAPLPAGLVITTVEDKSSLQDFIDVNAEAFGMPVEGMSRLLTMGFIADPGWRAYLGALDGRPVAASMLQLDGDIAGVYFVGTRADYRNRGLGAAMTWHTVREGAAAGCIIGALQASDMGKPVYERMGFRVVAGYRTFVRND